MIIRQRSSDTARLNQTNMIAAFNDTDGYYDQMQPELCTIVLRRLGFLHNVAISYPCTCISIKHKILTTHGISTEIITNNTSLRFEGSRKDSTASGP